MNLFKNENIDSEILKIVGNRTEDGIIVDAKIRKVKNVGFLYIQKKHAPASAYMIQLIFEYILYSLYIVFMYKKHAKEVIEGSIQMLDSVLA